MNTIKVAAVAVVLTGGYLVYSLFSGPSDISPRLTAPATNTSDKPSVKSTQRNTVNLNEVSQPVEIQSNLPTFDLTEYNESERLLEQLSYTEIPPERIGNIGEFIDPDDETYQHVITNPGSIGEFIDPEDETYFPEITNPGHIGEPIDIDAIFQ